jgi:hypothetical protein
MTKLMSCLSAVLLFATGMPLISNSAVHMYLLGDSPTSPYSTNTASAGTYTIPVPASKAEASMSVNF